MSKEELLKLLEELPDSGREKLALIAQGMLIAQSSKEEGRIGNGGGRA